MNCVAREGMVYGVRVGSIATVFGNTAIHLFLTGLESLIS